MARSKPKTSSARGVTRWLDRLLALPRPFRMLIAFIPAVTLVLLVQPVIDSIYLRFFLDRETVGVPAWLIAVLALLMYFAGWMLLVGPAGQKPARNRALWAYVILSLLTIGLVIFIYVLQWLTGIQ